MKGLIVVFACLLLQACAGVELGGKLGVYRVDQKRESQATYAKKTVPFRCLFWPCTNTQDREAEVHGS